jgi:hypothetical protein
MKPNEKIAVNIFSPNPLSRSNLELTTDSAILNNEDKSTSRSVDELHPKIPPLTEIPASGSPKSKESRILNLFTGKKSKDASANEKAPDRERRKSIIENISSKIKSRKEETVAMRTIIFTSDKTQNDSHSRVI